MRVEQQTGRRCTLLAEKIKERGITQADVAIGLDITRASMSRKMNGMQPFKIIEIFKIIQILGIPKEEIYDIFFKEYENVIDMDDVWAALEMSGAMKAPHSLRETSYTDGKD